MKIVRVLTILIPVLAFAAAGDSTAAKRGWLGVYTDDLTKPMLVALDVDHGVLVTDVVEESPAAKSGIEVGDVITSLDGKATTDGSALRWAVRDRPDKTVEIAVRRRGKNRNLSATLAARELTEQAFNFEWPVIPKEALREYYRALRQAGPELKQELKHSDLILDSLRKQMQELKENLNELRRKLTEKQKSE